MRTRHTACFVSLLFAVSWTACSEHKKSAEQFPVEVEEIFHSSCAGSTCHVDAGAHDLLKINHDDEHGGGLDLTEWETLFQGSYHGAVIIPFSSKFSHLMKHLTGEQLLMPPGSPLPQDEIDIVRQWINEGAPSRDGSVAFAGRTSRIFTTNQDSDVVTVLDAASMLAMRVFPVGVNASFESPHGLQISPDGRYFYVSMIVGQTVLKYDAFSGEFVDSVHLGKPLALIRLSGDGMKLYVTTNFDINNPTATDGQVTVIRTSDMQTLGQIPVGVNPHGINVSRDGLFIYVTAVNSDRVYVIDTRADTLFTNFEVDTDPSPNPDFEPYHVALSPANSAGYEDYLLITCRKAAKVRVFQRQSLSATQHSFSPVATLNVGAMPIQLEGRTGGDKFYAANYGANTVSVIHRIGGSFTVEKTLSTRVVNGDTLYFSGPNGVAVSPDGNYVFVTNRNRTGAGGHHGGTGGGFLTVIDAVADELIRMIELPPDAYSVVVTP